MGNRFIYLIRHGDFEPGSMSQDDPDGPLTELGRQQVQAVGQKLRSLPVTTIHYSTAQRTAETAAVLAADFPQAAQAASQLLRECIPCVPPAFRQQFAHLPPEFIQQGGLQAQQAFEMYFMPISGGANLHEILVSHGNLICYLVCRALQAPCESWVLTDIAQGGFSEIRISESGMTKVLHHNETGHLPR